MNSPLMVLLLRLGPADDSAPYASAIRTIFGDGATNKELLEVTELREFQLADAAAAAITAQSLDFLASADRLLVLVLDTRSATGLPANNALTPFEDALFQKINSIPGAPSRQRVLHIYLKEPGGLYDSSPADTRLVRLGLKELDERDLRIAFLTLYTLRYSIQLFNPDKARLFFSHAKRDGVPLTTATGDWIDKRLRGFDTFYDTNDLDLTGDIEAQLNKAVESAIVIVFRSDVFDQRYWCQKEVLWAEQHRRPVITVDARWQIEHSPSVISFDSTPVVRIPDGSVVRIFTAALMEALRVELFTARVGAHGTAINAARVRAVPRLPSLVSLYGACQALCDEAARNGSGRSFIVYPNPSLPQLMLQSAQGLAEKAIAGCEVKSLDEFRLVV